MPAKAVRRKGKWRVIDDGGRIVKNKAGTAADGGGHTKPEAAKRQARAINASLSRQGKIE